MMGLLMDELPLTHVQAGVVLAASGLAYVSFGILGGLLGDWIGARTTMGIGVIIMGCFGFLRGFSSTFSTLVIYTVLHGIGTAITMGNVPKLIESWFSSEKLGAMLGICNSGYSIGSFIALAFTMRIVFPLIGSWQGVLRLYGIFNLIVAASWWLLTKENSETHIERAYSSHNANKFSFKEGLISVAKSKNTWLLCAIAFFVLGAENGVVGWLPHILELKGLPNVTAGLITSVAMVGNFGGNIILPTLSDRVGTRKPFIYISVLMLGLGIYIVGTTLGPALWITTALIGFCIGSLWSVIFTIVLESPETDPKFKGIATGLIITIGHIGWFIQPIIAGYIKDSTGTFLPAMIFLACTVEICLVLGLLLAETGKRERGYIKQLDS
jgi:cyanate permease